MVKASSLASSIILSMNWLEKREDIDLQLSKENIHKLFVQQIAQDFSRCSIEIDSSQLEILFDAMELNTTIALAIQKHHNKLDQILYIIDVPEKYTLKLDKEKPNFLQDLAMLILKRVLQKVLTRLAFQ